MHSFTVHAGHWWLRAALFALLAGASSYADAQATQGDTVPVPPAAAPAERTVPRPVPRLGPSGGPATQAQQAGPPPDVSAPITNPLNHNTVRRKDLPPAPADARDATTRPPAVQGSSAGDGQNGALPDASQGPAPSRTAPGLNAPIN